MRQEWKLNNLYKLFNFHSLAETVTIIQALQNNGSQFFFF